MTSNYTATHAAAHERLMGRWSRVLAEQFVAFAGVEIGDCIVEAGCDTGSLTLALSARSEPAVIVGVDLLEPYIAQARTRTRDARLSFRVGDAAALDLPDGSFDRAFLAGRPDGPRSMTATAWAAKARI